MKFIETRGNDTTRAAEVEFSEAILNPSASFGGLYVPKELPVIDEAFINAHINASYKELAFDIIKLFGVDIEDSVLKEALSLYEKFDDSEHTVPMAKVKDDFYVSELFHGPTRAFKDMALQPFGHILSHLAQKRDEKYLILTATSGDTGPAALHTFANKENIQVVCMYPDGGTSDVQRLQMVTTDAKNEKVLGIVGNFDDAQSALKNLLKSESFKANLQEKNISLSAANSVNFGRIIFQIIYHVHAYIELLNQKAIKIGEEIYLIVPSGNFGNVLGGFYAKLMGLPIRKLIVASNDNNVLTELIQTGEYNIKDRKLLKTNSPAMDILKSSNVERVLFHLFGAERTKEMMLSLEENSRYTLTKDELTKLQNFFSATFCTDEEGLVYMKEYFENNYLMDPHTATCVKAYEECREESLKTVCYSTAEWTKFSPTIAKALGLESDIKGDIEALEFISKKAGMRIPEMIQEVFNKKQIHTDVVEKTEIEAEILKFI